MQTVKRFSVILLSLFILLFYLLDIKAQVESEPITKTVAEGNTAFALDLYNELKTESGNLFFSPYSISTALAMTYGGARENTAEQMEKVLHLPHAQNTVHAAFANFEGLLKGIQSNGNIELNVANGLWAQNNYHFLPEFLTLVKSNYNAKVNYADFKNAYEQARKEINDWVENQTNEKINNFLPRGILNALTRLVLVNAIYFKGNWVYQFDANLTKNAPFNYGADKSIEVPMMTQKRQFGYRQTDKLQILELPYAGSSLSMIILLPTEDNGLKDIEQGLSVNNVKKWTTNLSKRDVKVFLPRFKLTGNFRLEKTLPGMGMPDAFNMNADFSGMDGTKMLYISAVIHKAFIDVNEEGTEAAAATGVIMVKAVSWPPPVVFRADHPFLFLIRENSTGTILFLGRIVEFKNITSTSKHAVVLIAA